MLLHRCHPKAVKDAVTEGVAAFVEVLAHSPDADVFTQRVGPDVVCTPSAWPPLIDPHLVTPQAKNSGFADMQEFTQLQQGLQRLQRTSRAGQNSASDQAIQGQLLALRVGVATDLVPLELPCVEHALHGGLQKRLYGLGGLTAELVPLQLAS